MIRAAVNVLVLALLVGLGVAAHALRDEIMSLHSRLDEMERDLRHRRAHLREVA